MNDMATKKSDKTKRKDPPGSRHKPRKMVSLRPSIYEQLAVLASRNHRPLSWENELILIAALEQAGLWPPPEEEETAY